MGHHALDQAAQDAAWVLAFRQGTRDSVTASRLLGVRWAEERSWSTGRKTRENVRIVEAPYVSASTLEDLEKPDTAKGLAAMIRSGGQSISVSPGVSEPPRNELVEWMRNLR